MTDKTEGIAMHYIDDEFLKSEERNGYFVSAEMKKLWAIELGCLEQLQHICQKHGLRYFAASGTLLGAVRHHAFIPWDDDMDFWMPAEDYKKFCDIAPQELEEPYFFRNFETDYRYSADFSCICNGNTTFITQYDQQYISDDYRCCISIDVFPLQGIQDNFVLRLKQKLLALFLKYAIYGYRRQKNNLTNGKYCFRDKVNVRVIYWNLIKRFMDINALYKKYLTVCNSGGSNSNEVTLVSYWNFKHIFKRRWFKEIIDIPFERGTLPCPYEYDNVLKAEYGDWRIPKITGGDHVRVLFDAEMSCKEKIKVLKSNRQCKLISNK